MTVKDFIEWAGTMQFQENKIMLEKVKSILYPVVISLKTLKVLEKE